MPHRQSKSDNAKYVVFKRSDFYRMMNALLLEVDQSIVKDIWAHDLPDAIVIRRQDSFAPPALDAYSNMILAALEVDKKMTTEPNPREDKLRSIADYFHEQACKSWQTDRKLPD